MHILFVTYIWYTCFIEYVDALQITYDAIVDIFVWFVNWKFTEFFYENIFKELAII